MPERRAQTVEAFLDELSSASPAPGGGSVAALAGSLAAALGLMVCAIAAKKRETPSLTSLCARILALKERFLALVDEDEGAFLEVVAAYRLPKGSSGRQDRIQAALVRAASVPLETAAAARDLLTLLGDLAPLGTRSSVSDVGVGVVLARSAVESALLNVDTNLTSIADRRASEELRARRDALLSEAEALASEGLRLVRGRL